VKQERWQEIKRIYTSALELGPDCRRDFIRQASNGDEGICREVESLLARQTEAESFMNEPAMEVAAKAMADQELESNLAGRAVLHYLMIDKIGTGGMGVVYSARDTKLDRQVAIKVLPDIFSGDRERVARFEREARLLASLNHPNIAAIYGLEHVEGKRLLVMELAEGETLAQRIAKGPLPVGEALEVCKQVAEGLEAAHEKGIIHRDLKPANVKTTLGGKVKILDFGLAKAFQAEPSDSAGQSPDISEAMTRAGVILGTAAYMSPEQARGKPVDKRTDIWAFGCLLYECLAGKRVFRGETVTDAIAKILEAEPDWNLLPKNTPWTVRALIRKCLQKDPKLRYHDIADARLEIEAPAVQTAPRRFSLQWLAAIAAVLVAGILIGLALKKYFQPAASAFLITSTIKVEPGHWLAGGRSIRELQRPSRTAMAISSDGRFVVYSAIEENPGPQTQPQLYLRRMDQAEAKPIAGTEGGISPFLSPDNRLVGYWADRQLKKVPVEGGVPATLCDAPSIFGASWGPDNSIVFTDGSAAGLSRVSADGGKPENLTTPDPKREESSHRLPSWLPDGKAVLFTVMKNSADQQPRLALLRLDTREWHVLLQDAADAKYVSTGHLVFLKQGTLMTLRFDPAGLKVIGQPSPLVENVMQAFAATDSGYNTGAGQFGVSDSGALVYAAGGILPDPKDSLVWVDQKGIEQPVTPLRFPFLAPRLSPDGQRITYVTSGREMQVYVYDLNTGTNSPLTTEGMAVRSIWAPDAKRIVFGWGRSTVFNLFSQPYDDSSPMERLTTSDYSQRPGSWSSDGQTLALVQHHPATGFDILLLEASSGRVRPFLNTQFNEAYPEFSPDGRWMAYSSDESNRNEVYVRLFPGPGIKHQVSSQGGTQPLWARNGKQLFYRWQDQVWAADVRADGGFSTGKPRLLFERPGYFLGYYIRTYDLALDGQRFLMVKLESKPTPVTEMIFVQNWFEELKRLVPNANK